jgi:hypothetical protein
MHVHPPPLPPVHPPPGHVHPPPLPSLKGWLAVGNKKKMQVFYLRLDLLTVEPRAVDPHCFGADPEPDPEPEPDPAQNLDADLDPDPDPDPGGGGGRSAKNVHPPWQNPRYAPVSWYLAAGSNCRRELAAAHDPTHTQLAAQPLNNTRPPAAVRAAPAQLAIIPIAPGVHQPLRRDGQGVGVPRPTGYIHDPLARKQSRH